MSELKVKNQKKSNTAKKNSVVTPSDVLSKNIKSTSTAKKTSVSHEPASMEELLAQTGYQLTIYKRGNQIKARVIDVTSKRLLLDTGGKSEAVVHEKEIPYISDILKGIKAGDIIDAHVVEPENERGQMVVSLRRTAMLKRWEILADRMETGKPITVVVRNPSRGGFIIDYQGLRGFIPLSQTTPDFSRLGEKATGRAVQAKIIDLDRANNRLVLSQSQSSVSTQKQQELLKQISVGQVYQAEVTGLAPFGAFVTVAIDASGSLPGLIHISEIAWEKVDNPSHYLKTGQKMDVKLINVDTNTGRLTLSLKQLTKDPWDDIAKMFSVEQTIKGKVSRISNYGVFVNILPGVEGLIHISKMAPGEEPKLGEEIECVIEEINTEGRKISLSLVTKAKPIGYR